MDEQNKIPAHLDKFLRYLITHNYVSVLNVGNMNVYTITAAEFGQIMNIRLSANYSYVAVDDVWVKYDLTINEETIAEATKPVISKSRDFLPRNKNDVLAKKLDRLLRMCSNRVIAQEKLAQSNAMLKGLRTDFKTYGS